MKHPYGKAPAYARWSKGVAALPAGAVDPVVTFPFKVKRTDKIVTAGSCFAQHIARNLTAAGFNHHVVETPHPILRGSLPTKYNYGMYSARYGNIYSSRQLRQLFERALGLFEPQEDIWRGERGYVDPFRPTIQPGDFRSRAELQNDRARHLACVAKAMRELDVFVFTMGLTETWVSAADGAAFPICPGVEGGEFSAKKHKFVNLSLDDVVGDMRAAIELLRGVNPKARVILTVSPVPLAATALDRHVLVSTTLSKSVLRVAADVLSRDLKDVCYFPSYEIITGAHARGAYFAEDLRSVTDAGVSHVMGLFFKHVAEDAPQTIPATPTASSVDQHTRQMQTVTEVLCEEAALDR